MIAFTESNFYKALQDFFVNNNKETFLEMLGEFYNRTQVIIDKNESQDDIIKELRELYITLNEKNIDNNIVKEKVNYFLENSNKIQKIYLQLSHKTNITKINDLQIHINNLLFITTLITNNPQFLQSI